MGLFLASWSLGFFALFAAQLYVRLDAVSWPPANVPQPPRALAGVSTLIALASSWAYHWGLRGIELDRSVRLVRGLFTATLLSFLFLLSQLAAAYQSMARGLVWNEGVYGAFFWVIGGFHYAHVVVGFSAGVWLLTRAQARAYHAQSHLTVRLWGYYWHSIGALWLLIYVFIFLL